MIYHVYPVPDLPCSVYITDDYQDAQDMARRFGAVIIPYVRLFGVAV